MRTAARIFAPLVALGLSAAPAAAEILDVQAESTPDSLRILFVFDVQPTGASITVEGARAEATIAGAHGSGRVLRPQDGVLRQLTVADRPLGLSVGAVAGRTILGGEATVFRDSVLFELTLAPAPETAAAPVPLTPDADSGPEPATQLALAEPAAPPEPAPAPELAEPELAEPEPSGPPAPPGSGLSDAEIEAAVAAAEAEAEAKAKAEAEAKAKADADRLAAAAEVPEGIETDGQAIWDEGGAARADAEPGAAAPPGAPGAASELLAAALDRVSCDAAAQAVSADPWALDALYDHGACLARDGQTARAREVFQRLSTFDPSSARTLVALGVLEQDAGRRQAAMDYYDRAMDVSPDDGLATLINMLRRL